MTRSAIASHRRDADQPNRAKPEIWWSRKSAMVLGAWFFCGLSGQTGVALVLGRTVTLGDRSFDSALLALQAEHQRTVLTNGSQEYSLVEAPYFFPFPYSGSLTDLQLGLVPLFAFFRFLDLSILEARAAITCLHGISAFAIGMLLLRELYPVCSSFLLGYGAFLCAFGLTRTAALDQPHLLAQEMWLLAIWTILRALRNESLRGWMVPYLIMLLALQAWMSIQVLLHSLAFVGCCILVGLMFRDGRTLGTSLCRGKIVPLIIALGIAGLLLYPLVTLYLEVGSLVNPLNPSLVRFRTGPLWSVLVPDPHNPLRKPIHDCLEAIGFGVEEIHAQGIGVFTSILVAIGIVAKWKSRAWALLTVSLGFYWVMISEVPLLGSVWRELTSGLPLLEALRRPNRVVHVLTPLIGAWAISGAGALMKRPGFTRWVRAVILLSAAEQVDFKDAGNMWMNLKSDALLRSVKERCESFLVVSENAPPQARPQVHLIAMQAAIESGRPTFNGYSGRAPKKWGLGAVTGDGAYKRLQDQLERFFRRYGGTTSVCVYDYDYVTGQVRLREERSIGRHGSLREASPRESRGRVRRSLREQARA